MTNNTDTNDTEDERSPDSRFDGTTECLTCDRVNVSNAVHGVLQLVSCPTNDIDTVEEALTLVNSQVRRLGSEQGGDSVER